GSSRWPVFEQITRPRAFTPGAVAWVEQAAALEREATAADAAGELVAQALERLDAALQLVVPAGREALPVNGRRVAAVRQGSEGAAHRLERDAHALGDLDDGDAPQHAAPVAPLIAGRARRRDQAERLVVAQRRGRDAAAPRQFRDRQLVRQRRHPEDLTIPP